jgi:hypothetical protein
MLRACRQRLTAQPTSIPPNRCPVVQACRSPKSVVVVPNRPIRKSCQVLWHSAVPRICANSRPKRALRSERMRDHEAWHPISALQARFLTLDAAFNAPCSAGLGLNALLMAVWKAWKSRLESVTRVSRSSKACAFSLAALRTKPAMVVPIRLAARERRSLSCASSLRAKRAAAVMVLSNVLGHAPDSAHGACWRAPPPLYLAAGLP